MQNGTVHDYHTSIGEGYVELCVYIKTALFAVIFNTKQSSLIPHYYTASVQTSAQMYDAAHKTIKKALKYAPTSGKVLHAQTRNFYFQKKYHKCIESGKMWLKYHPKSSEALLLIASSYYEMKQNVEALKFYEQVLKLDPTHAGVLVNTAVILNAFGRYEEAANHSSKAVEIAPNLVEVHLAICVCVCVCVCVCFSNYM